jgi:hypothetical protein
MQPLHLKDDHQGRITPNAEVDARIALLAKAILLQTGAVIDMSQDAYRYGEHSVIRLSVTGLSDRAIIAFSSVLEPLEHEDFSQLVVDCVDAVEMLEALRTRLRVGSVPLLCQDNPGAPAGNARALAIADVIRWHNAQIAYFRSQRARMKQWSDDNEGDPPGSFYDTCLDHIANHEHAIARMAELAC